MVSFEGRGRRSKDCRRRFPCRICETYECESVLLLGQFVFASKKLDAPSRYTSPPQLTPWPGSRPLTLRLRPPHPSGVAAKRSQLLLCYLVRCGGQRKPYQKFFSIVVHQTFRQCIAHCLHLPLLHSRVQGKGQLSASELLRLSELNQRVEVSIE